MAKIRKIEDKNGSQFYPQTHVGAVVDDYGNSVESILESQQALIEQKQMDVGAVPSDLYPIKDSTHWVTSDGIYNNTASFREDLDADLDIVDEEGLVLARFINGGIRTKEFNSADTPSLYPDEYADLDIADGNGLVAVRIVDGQIKTLKFDSRFMLENWLSNKNVAIIGDSISTNGNTGEYSNVPEIKITAEDVGVQLSAYLTYYDVQANLSIAGHTFTTSEIGTEVTFTPTVDDVGKVIGLPNNYNANNVTTWWEVAAQKLNFNPIPVCWSGSSITSHDMLNSYNTGTNAHKMDCSYAWHESQIRKCGIRVAGSMTRVAPDVIIIYRGTNDFSHAVNVKLTEGYFDNVNFSVPQTDDIGEGYYGYKQGLVMTIAELRNTYPYADIIICTLNVFKRINYSAFPTNNGLNTLPQWNNAIREVADYMGCGVIELDKDGITFENCYPTYISDSATTPTHPNDNGHYVMGQKAIVDLLNYKNK